MSESYLPLIESAVNDLLSAFDVTAPPVPVEVMLQRPKAGMWKEVNLSELSAAFINIRQRYSPRMSIARLLVRYICRSEWGQARHLDSLLGNDAAIRAFARALLVPRTLLLSGTTAHRDPAVLSVRYEIPEDDVRLRLVDLGYLPAQDPEKR
jgi:hypothetical protein